MAKKNILVIIVIILLCFIYESGWALTSRYEPLTGRLEVGGINSGPIYYLQNYTYIHVLPYDDGPGVGDVYDAGNMIHLACIAYMSYEIPSVPVGYHLQTAILHVYIYIMYGNSVAHNYPIFNNGTNTWNPDFLIEHINYGDSFTYIDVFPEVLDSAEVVLNTQIEGWITYDVTSWLREDIDSRTLSQYRLYLDGFSDWDIYEDNIYIADGPYFNYSPHVIYTLQSDSTAIEDNTLPLAENNLMLQVYPNPFKRSTTISYHLDKASDVILEVYNTKGQRIRQLVNAKQAKGEQVIQWDGKDSNGSTVCSGVYFAKMQYQGKQISRKMIYMK